MLYSNDSSSSGSTSEDTEHFSDAVQNLIIVGILIVAILLSALISVKRWNRFLPESGAAMIFGCAVGLTLALISSAAKWEKSFEFQPEIFYWILLPPIIFEAGFSMNRKNFFRNMGTILLFAVFGTMISFLLIGYGLFWLTKIGAITSLSTSHPLESLLFGALLSATDPVATLSILGSLGEDVDQLLHSLIFGESVLNDAMAIVLFRTLSSFEDSLSFTVSDLTFCIGQFFIVSISSIAIGIGMGLISAFFFKRMQSIMHNLPHLELSVMVLFAYLSYLVSELLQMSGVMSLFLTGVVMKHYNWYSLSEGGQTACRIFFQTLSFICETFVFVYLGTSVGTSINDRHWKWDPSLCFFALVLCFLSRAFNIFPLSALSNLGRQEKISIRMQVMLWFSGLRGAVAFALALSAGTQSRSVLVTSTLFIVMFTTLFLGCLTTTLLKKLNLLRTIHHSYLKLSTNEEEEQFMKEDYDEDNTYNNERSKRSSLSIVHSKWKLIDERFLKPCFGGSPRKNYSTR